MDMKISGSGHIPAGEYDSVRVSGSGHLHGSIRCRDFHCSGSTKGEGNIVCQAEFLSSGGCKINGSLTAGSAKTSGSFKCGEQITVTGAFSCSGSVKCSGSLKCGEFASSGAVSIGGEMEAESVHMTGVLNCAGLMNAEKIDLRFDHGMEIGSIGGSDIDIRPDKWTPHHWLYRLGILKQADYSVLIRQAIEGDRITLINVTAPRVSGRTVTIGDGCRIDLVQYSEQIEISPKATVGKTEKIDRV